MFFKSLFFVGIVLLCVFVSVGFAETGEDAVVSALAGAEASVVSAYQGVLEAERAGANVSVLLVRLNEAGGFLSQARMAYKAGDFDGAVDFAELGRGIGEEVAGEARVLRDLATIERVQLLWFTAAASVLAVAWIAFGSFMCWRFFKRRYYRRVLGLKPEVATPDES